MKYSKPELIQLGSTANIQGQSKEHGCIFDSAEPGEPKTCSAYEADE